VDILQTDINHVGGITALWKVALSRRALSSRKRQSHGRHRPTFDNAHRDRLLGSRWRLMPVKDPSAAWQLSTRTQPCPNGRFPLPEKPGLGFDLTEEALKKYPFGGNRPMARVFHQDGSVAAW